MLFEIYLGFFLEKFFENATALSFEFSVSYVLAFASVLLTYVVMIKLIYGAFKWFAGLAR